MGVFICGRNRTRSPATRNNFTCYFLPTPLISLSSSISSPVVSSLNWLQSNAAVAYSMSSFSPPINAFILFTFFLPYYFPCDRPPGYPTSSSLPSSQLFSVRASLCLSNLTSILFLASKFLILSYLFTNPPQSPVQTTSHSTDFSPL